MRVVAGTARGRLLRAPAGRRTRPTADRVREALFSMLAGAVDLREAVVVDLFAGSGALGIEALSRGAARATFVESDRAALAAIDANLAALGLGPERARVVRGEVLGWLRGAAGVPAGLADEVPTVVFADPPYAFDRWAQLLEAVRPWASLAVLETGSDLDVGAGWATIRQRRYGATVVTIARPAALPAAAVEPKGGT